MDTGSNIGKEADMADKDAKKGITKDSNTERTLNKIENHLDTIRRTKTVSVRLAHVAKVSELLSSVWDLPPAQLLRFHSDMDVREVDPHALPGWGGDRGDAEHFMQISSLSIARYQRLLYANGTKKSNKRLLIVLQGMDASGKGGIVRHVFSQGDPMGIHYHGFGAPTDEEKQHDYLWRVKRQLPQNGWIGIFDRSHYEDIVMPRIYGTVPEDQWRARYDEINTFEHDLVAGGCTILKIFLVSSKEEQKKHFLDRLDDPTKYWKFDPSDLEARERWDEYMDAWQEVFEKTSTDDAPWYIVPADNRWYSRAVASELLRISMRNMNLMWPPLSVDADEMRRRLEND